MLAMKLLHNWQSLHWLLKILYVYGLSSVVFWYFIYFGIRAEESPIPVQIYMSGLGYRSSLLLSMTAITHILTYIFDYAKSSSKDLVT